jgi:hypothetical protein
MSKAPTEILAPAIELDIAVQSQAATDKAAFHEMPSDGQEAYRKSHSSNFNRVQTVERGVVVATSVHALHDHADSLATEVASKTIAEQMGRGTFEGLNDKEAADKLFDAGATANAAIKAEKEAKAAEGDTSWENARANVSAMRFFRNDQGKQRLAVYDTGDNWIGRLRPDPATGDAVLTRLSNPEPPVNGLPQGGLFGGEHHPGIGIYTDVLPGDRYVIVDKTLGVSDNSDPFNPEMLHVTDEAIAEAANPAKHADPKQAAKEVTKIPTEVAAAKKDVVEVLADSTMVVLDVKEQRGEWNRVEKILRMPTRLWVKMQLRSGERRELARERYLNNPTLPNRVAMVALDTGALVGGAYLALLGARLGGHELGHMFGSGGTVAAANLGDHLPAASSSTPATHNMVDFSQLNGGGSASPSVSPDASVSHAVTHSATAHPEVTHPTSATPHASASTSHSATPHASASASHHSASPKVTHSASAHPHPTSHSATPKPAHTAGGNSVVPGDAEHHGAAASAAAAGSVDINLNHLDPNHLPSSVHLTPDEKAWLNASHSEGHIGAFEGHAGADGLGHPGTVWHSAMKGLHDAGYDPKQLTHEQQGQYVKYVLSLNHMDLKQAAHQQDNFTPVMPTNGDIISHITHITAGNHNGPLLPAANSPAGIHLSQIQHTVESQTHTRTSGGTSTGHVPGYNPGGPVPTPHASTPPTTPHTPSASTSPSTSHAPHASATTSHAPSATATTKHGAVATPDHTASAKTTHHATARPEVSHTSTRPTASPDASAKVTHTTSPATSAPISHSHSSASASRSPEVVIPTTEAHHGAGPVLRTSGIAAVGSAVLLGGMLYHNEIRDYVTTRAQAAVDKREAADAAKRDAYDKFLAAKQGEAARQRAAAARAAGIAVAEQQRKAAEEPIPSFLDDDDEGEEGTTSQSNSGPKPLRPATPGSNGGPAPTRRSRYGNSLPTDPTDSRRS